MTDVASLGVRFFDEGYASTAGHLDAIAEKTDAAEQATGKFGEAQKKANDNAAASGRELATLESRIGKLAGTTGGAQASQAALNRMMDEATKSYRSGALSAQDYVKVMDALKARASECSGAFDEAGTAGAGLGDTMLSMIGIASLVQLGISALVGAVAAENRAWNENIDALQEKIRVNEELAGKNRELADSSRALAPVILAEASALRQQAAAAREALQAERDRLAFRAQMALADPNTGGYSRSQYRLDTKVNPALAEADQQLLRSRISEVQARISDMQSRVRDAKNQLDRGQDNFGRPLDDAGRAALAKTIADTVAQAMRDAPTWQQQRDAALAAGKNDLARQYGVGLQSIQAVIQEGAANGSGRGGASGGGGVSVDASGRFGTQAAAAVAGAQQDLLRAQLALTDDVTRRASLEESLADLQDQERQAQLDRMAAEITGSKNLDDATKTELLAQIDKARLVQQQVAALQRQAREADRAEAARKKEEADREKAAKEALDAATLRLEGERGMLRHAAEMATTLEERRKIDERLRDTADELLRIQLQAVIDAKGSSAAQKAAAQAQLAALNAGQGPNAPQPNNTYGGATRVGQMVDAMREPQDRVKMIREMYAELARLRDQDLVSEQEAADVRVQIARMEADARFETANNFLTSTAQLAASHNKSLAAIGKAAAIAQALRDGVLAVMNAYAHGGPFPLNIASAAVMTALVAEQIAQIRAMADGGWVGGSGGPRSDNQLTWLSPGEHVTNAMAAARNRDALNAINRGAVIPAEATRGPAVNDNGGGAPAMVNLRITLDNDMLRAEIVDTATPVAVHIANRSATRLDAAQRRRTADSLRIGSR